MYVAIEWGRADKARQLGVRIVESTLLQCMEDFMHIRYQI